MRVIFGWLTAAVLYTSLAALAQDSAPQDDQAADPAADSKAAAPQAEGDDPPATDPPATDPPPTVPKGNPDAPEVKEFYTQYEEFKSLVQRLRDIQRDYKVVKPTGREALEEEFKEKVLDSHQRFLKLREAAVAAFRANPADHDIADVLGSTALAAGESGHYEDAIAKLKVLAEMGYRPDAVADPLGRYSFQVSDYDTAEKYLKQADEAKNISHTGKELLSRIADERKLWQEETAARERDAAAAEPLPQVRLKTTQGDVLIELFEDDAPNTVANFINLVEQGYYDDMPFTVIQPGIRVNFGTVSPSNPKLLDYKIASEGHGEKFRRHFRGSLSIDLPPGGDKDSGCEHLSIALRPERLLDPLKTETGQHQGTTVFGRVIEGWEAFNGMAPFDFAENKPPVDKVIDAEVVRKRQHPYEVKKFEPAKPEDSQPEKDDASKATDPDGQKQNPEGTSDQSGKDEEGSADAPDSPQGGTPDSPQGDAPEQP